uniref:WAP domain-containing protein n=1 Tax=Equus asinus TaxID=9793 RepID=A0A8C4M0I2_EQUAS
MKTCAVLVLVAFITLGMELACTWRQPFIREERSGVCPKMPKVLASGMCLQCCFKYESCPEGMKCCPNACGRVGKYPVLKVRISQLRLSKGVDNSPVDFSGAEECSLSIG